MEATIHPAEHGELPRLEQLFRKTNQFNLTSRAYDQSELMRVMSSPNGFCLSGWLKDRLANHGLVSAIVGRVEGEVMTIDNWVMSCRVFTRTFEECIFAQLLDLAREQRCQIIRGEFVATAKNGYAGALYERLGFQAVGCSPAGHIFESGVEKAPTPKTFVRTLSIQSSIATETARA
jgi:FkbH-like protein